MTVPDGFGIFVLSSSVPLSSGIGVRGLSRSLSISSLKVTARVFIGVGRLVGVAARLDVERILASCVGERSYC